MTRGKVLVVDDEPELVRSVSMRLKSQGYDVLTAMDGFQATRTAMKELPDVIVLDIGMPAGDGHQVAERLQSSVDTCAIPIIFLTARSTEKDYQKALTEGVTKYITKPFDADELLSAIDELIMRQNLT